MGKLIIFGTGEIAELAHYHFTKDGRHEVVAFTVDAGYKTCDSFKELPVLEFADVHKVYPPESHLMFVAVSYSSMNKVRAAKYAEVKARGYRLASYISPRATIYDNVEMGDNCFVFEDNTVQPFVRIGNNVTLWSGNHIGHHSTIGDHCFVASHAVISGGVRIEPYCFIGVNATIRDHVVIAEENVIGAGALILKSTKPREVYLGNAAQLFRLSSDQLRGI
jgi:sugar O-acyltransferase (sialic acid O-acetyltransferase NeuD family)